MTDPKNLKVLFHTEIKELFKDRKMASDRMYPGQFTVKYISGSKYIAYLSYHAFCAQRQIPKQKTM